MTLRARRLPLIAGIVALTTLAAACTDDSQAARSAANVADDANSPDARTVDVAMEDIKFDQTALTVKAGETIAFRFTNNGEVAHDAFIGDDAAQIDHEAEMAEMAGMAGMSDTGGHTGGHTTEEAAIVLQPGNSGELSHTFDEPGTYQVGCHQPGHYAAGMKIDVTVE